MPKHNILNAVNAGIQGYQSGVDSREKAARFKEDRALQLADAQYKRDTRPDAALQKSNADVQAQLAIEQNQMMGAALFKSQFNGAMRRSQVDGNMRHLTDALKNPFAAEVFPNLGRVDKLNLDDDIDIQGATKRMHELDVVPEGDGVGPTPFAGQAPEDPLDEADFLRSNPELLKRFVRTTGRDGAVDIMDINALKNLTGYYEEQDDIANAKELKEVELENKRNKYKQGKRDKLPSNIRSSIIEGEAQGRKDRGEPPLVGDVQILADAKRNREGLGTPEQRTANHVKQIKKKMVELAGDEEAVKALDFSDPTTRDKYEDLVFELMDARGDKFSDKEKTAVGVVRNLAQLADTATIGLDERGTGFLDNLWLNVKQYFSDDITDLEGAAARAAYSQMLNTILKRDSGSVVTKHEMARMTKSFGSLNLQLKPAMARMKEQVRSLRESLVSVGSFKDSIVAKYFLGGSVTNIDDTIARIDQVLGAGLAPGKLKPLRTVRPTSEGYKIRQSDAAASLLEKF